MTLLFYLSSPFNTLYEHVTLSAQQVFRHTCYRTFSLTSLPRSGALPSTQPHGGNLPQCMPSPSLLKRPGVSHVPTITPCQQFWVPKSWSQALWLIDWLSEWLVLILIGFGNFSISARQHMLSALCAIARPSIRPSDCLSVTRVDHSKTVQVRIMELSPQSSTMTLFSTSSRNSTGNIGSEDAESQQ